MNIHFTEPLSAAWARMKKALFQPFNLEKWFTVGFTAFLAALLDGPSGGGNNNSNLRHRTNWDEVFNFPGYAMEWIASHPFWATFILFAIVFVFIVVVLLTWVSSRGKFMFLDNVVHDRAEVKKPWNEFNRQGNSLFVWRFFYGLICFVIIILSLYVAFALSYNMYYSLGSLPSKALIIISMIFYFFTLFVILGYISLFLDSFIIPIMYKNKTSVTKAWGIFIKLFAMNIGNFIVYGLFIFVLLILVVICVIAFGFMTCCIGFLLLIIPYIGSVVFLPVSYTFRAYSVEFLEQFGEEYQIFPKEKIEELEI